MKRTVKKTQSTTKHNRNKSIFVFFTVATLLILAAYGTQTGVQRYEQYVEQQNRARDEETLTQILKQYGLENRKIEEVSLQEELKSETVVRALMNYGQLEHLRSFYFGDYIVQIKSDRFSTESVNPEATNLPQVFLRNLTTGVIEIWDLTDGQLIARVEDVETYTDLPLRDVNLFVQTEDVNTLFYVHDFNRDTLLDFQIIKNESIHKERTLFYVDFHFYVSVDGDHKRVAIPEGLVLNNNTQTFIEFTSGEKALFDGEVAIKEYYLDKDRLVLFKTFYLRDRRWVNGARQNFGKGMVTVTEAYTYPGFFPMINMEYFPGEPLKVYGPGSTLDLYSYTISDDNLMGSITRSPDEKSIYYLDTLANERMMLMTAGMTYGKSIQSLDDDLTDRNILPGHKYRLGFISTSELLIVNDATGEKHIYIPSLTEWKDNPEIDETTLYFFNLMTAKRYSDPGFYAEAAKVKDTNTKKAIILSPEEFEARFGKRR